MKVGDYVTSKYRPSFTFVGEIIEKLTYPKQEPKVVMRLLMKSHNSHGIIELLEYVMEEHQLKVISKGQAMLYLLERE